MSTATLRGPRVLVTGHTGPALVLHLAAQPLGRRNQAGLKVLWLADSPPWKVWP